MNSAAYLFSIFFLLATSAYAEVDSALVGSRRAELEAELKQYEIQIEEYQDLILQKQKEADTLKGDIEILSSKTGLAEFLRKVRDSDDASLLELAFLYQNLSQFFGEMESTKNLQTSLQDAFVKFGDLKIQEENLRDELEQKRQEELELKTLQELQKKFLEGREKEKQKILKDTKGKESEYQKILKDKQKNAASIRSQLFLLVGSPSIPFEK